MFESQWNHLGVARRSRRLCDRWARTFLNAERADPAEDPTRPPRGRGGGRTLRGHPARRRTPGILGASVPLCEERMTSHQAAKPRRRSEAMTSSTTDHPKCTDPSCPARRFIAWCAQLIRSVSSGNRGQTALLEDSEKAVFALSDSIVQANSETRTETGRSQSPFSANPPPVYGGIEGGVHAEGDQRG